MGKWILNIFLAAQLMGFPSLFADEAKACPGGHAVFGRMSCSGISNSEVLLDAYFFGTTSMQEIQSTFPDRMAKIAERCHKKVLLRQFEREEVQFKVETVESCLGKRGYQEPCVKDDDCLEHYCHPERGTCSAVFTVPISAAQ